MWHNPITSGAMPWTLHCLLSQLSIPGKQCLLLHCCVLTPLYSNDCHSFCISTAHPSALSLFLVLIAFSLLWKNSLRKQVKTEKVYFGSLFQRVSAPHGEEDIAAGWESVTPGTGGSWPQCIWTQETDNGHCSVSFLYLYNPSSQPRKGATHSGQASLP